MDMIIEIKLPEIKQRKEKNVYRERDRDKETEGEEKSQSQRERYTELRSNCKKITRDKLHIEKDLNVSEKNLGEMGSYTEIKTATR